MTLAEQADAATTRDALAAAARLIRRTDLLIAAAHLDVHGKPHLKPVSDRLAGLAASLAPAEPESTPEPTPSAERRTQPQEAPRDH